MAVVRIEEMVICDGVSTLKVMALAFQDHTA